MACSVTSTLLPLDLTVISLSLLTNSWSTTIISTTNLREILNSKTSLLVFGIWISFQLTRKTMLDSTLISTARTHVSTGNMKITKLSLVIKVVILLHMMFNQFKMARNRLKNHKFQIACNQQVEKPGTQVKQKVSACKVNWDTAKSLQLNKAKTNLLL